MEEFRKKDAAEGLKIAQVLEGFISRKVVKQTVMTVVYGVTRYGGRLQIEKRLKEIDEFPEVACPPRPPRSTFLTQPLPVLRDCLLPCSLLALPNLSWVCGAEPPALQGGSGGELAASACGCQGVCGFGTSAAPLPAPHSAPGLCRSTCGKHLTTS